MDDREFEGGLIARDDRSDGDGADGHARAAGAKRFEIVLPDAIAVDAVVVREIVEERLRPQQATIQRLDAITEVSQRVLETLLAEIGWEVETFPDAAHLASWVGICPGQHESGGKRMKGRTRKGNRHAKTMLVQAAHAAGKTKTYLGAQYRRMSKGRSTKRAAVAVGHSILVIYYHMLTTSQPYQDFAGE